MLYVKPFRTKFSLVLSQTFFDLKSKKANYNSCTVLLYIVGQQTPVSL